MPDQTWEPRTITSTMADRGSVGFVLAFTFFGGGAGTKWPLEDRTCNLCLTISSTSTHISSWNFSSLWRHARSGSPKKLATMWEISQKALTQAEPFLMMYSTVTPLPCAMKTHCVQHSKNTNLGKPLCMHFDPEVQLFKIQVRGDPVTWFSPPIYKPWFL